MLPPNIRILVRGLSTILGLALIVAGLAGVATMSVLTALSSLGFIGVCALSIGAIFYSVALERIGLRSARRAATTLVVVLGGAALSMTGVLLALLSEQRFREEASTFGLSSAAGILVLAVLAAALALVWSDRSP